MKRKTKEIIKEIIKEIFWTGKTEMGCFWLALIIGLVFGMLIK